MSQILPASPLSVTSTCHRRYGQESVWFQVYFQTVNGAIRYVSGSGGEAQSAVDTNVNLNNQFAAVSWGGPESGIQQEERVYYLDDAGGIHERGWIYNRGWYDGSLNGQFKAAPYSNLAATTYLRAGIRSIRVYYQDATGKISEIGRDGGDNWWRGDQHPNSSRSTQIAAYTEGTGGALWYLNKDAEIVQRTFEANKPWKDGTFKSDAEYDNGANIAATGFGTLFSINDKNKLVVTSGSAQIWKTEEITSVIKDSGVAAIAHHEPSGAPGANKSIFVQNKTDELTIVRPTKDGKWSTAQLPIR